MSEYSDDEYFMLSIIFGYDLACNVHGYYNKKKTITALEKAHEAQIYVENIVNTVRETLVVLDSELRVVSTNNSFYVTFKVEEKETIGTMIYDMGIKQLDIPDLRKLFNEILPLKKQVNDYEVEHEFETIGLKTMVLNARQIILDKGMIILLAIEEITERQKNEQESLILKAAITHAPVGIALANKDINIYYCNPSGLGMRGGEIDSLIEIPKDAFENWQVFTLNGEPYAIENLPFWM